MGDTTNSWAKAETLTAPGRISRTLVREHKKAEERDQYKLGAFRRMIVDHPKQNAKTL